MNTQLDLQKKNQSALILLKSLLRDHNSQDFQEWLLALACTLLAYYDRNSTTDHHFTGPMADSFRIEELHGFFDGLQEEGIDHAVLVEICKEWEGVS